MTHSIATLSIVTQKKDTWKNDYKWQLRALTHIEKIKFNGATTLSITTYSITTLSIVTPKKDT